jgi:hypothetical protein
MRVGLVGGLFLSILAVGSPANAAGGGCREWSNGYFSFGACAYDQNGSVFGDAYTHTVTAPCKIRIQIWEDRRQGMAYLVSEKYFDCFLGHLGPIQAPKRGNYRYTAGVYAYSTSGTPHGLLGGSPTVT